MLKKAVLVSVFDATSALTPSRPFKPDPGRSGSGLSVTVALDVTAYVPEPAAVVGPLFPASC